MSNDFKKVFGIESEAIVVKGGIKWEEEYLFQPTDKPSTVGRWFQREVYPTPKYVRWETDYKGDYGKYILYDSIPESEQ